MEEALTARTTASEHHSLLPLTPLASTVSLHPHHKPGGGC